MLFVFVVMAAIASTSTQDNSELDGALNRLSTQVDQCARNPDCHEVVVPDDDRSVINANGDTLKEASKQELTKAQQFRLSCWFAWQIAEPKAILASFAFVGTLLLTSFGITKLQEDINSPVGWALAVAAVGSATTTVILSRPYLCGDKRVGAIRASSNQHGRIKTATRVNTDQKNKELKKIRKPLYK